MRYLILFISMFFLILCIESVWVSYIIIKGFFIIHVEQPIYFSLKLILRILMGGIFFYLSLIFFWRFKKSSL